MHNSGEEEERELSKETTMSPVSWYFTRTLTKAGRRNWQPRADTKEWHKMKEASQRSVRLGLGLMHT